MKTQKNIYIVDSNLFGKTYYSNKKLALKFKDYLIENYALKFKHETEPTSTLIFFNR